MSPGPWLRLTALGGAAGTLVAVVSGSAGLGAGHRVLAALALPPLAAVAAAAWIPTGACSRRASPRSPFSASQQPSRRPACTSRSAALAFARLVVPSWQP